jgi:hypothetical protein
MDRPPSDVHTGSSSSSSGGRKRNREHGSSKDDRINWHDAAASRFLSGNLSANSSLDMIQKAQKAGARGCEDLAKAGKSGMLKKKKRGKGPQTKAQEEVSLSTVLLGANPNVQCQDRDH